MPSNVDDLLRRAAADPHVIGLAGGLPASDRFPRRALARSFERRGSHIRVDAETYPSALTTFRGLGLVPTLSAQARVVYVMPAVGNPRGVSMTTETRRLRRYYRRRSERLMEALRKHLPAWRFETPQGGFGLWVDTGARLDEARLLRNCIEGGVSFDPGSSFRGDPDGNGTHLRLCFSAAPEDAFEEGARRLARAWRRTRGPRRTGRRR